MGKEQDLLEAARAGNLPLAERLLAARARLSGPLASLRRGPGANVQDSSGYTPLHHAALNGHKDIVQLLLSYEASPNILDTKGSSPLHLAAWAGHTGIVRLLLSHGPALTNVNLTTRDNESALHCAAQYGHTDVVFMLLQHGADPTVRSVRDETALDLASQYGRLETVELLVKTHPELLEPYRNPRGILPHTPLHRASKNGHKAVVVVLLKAGHAVNALTGAGAPLHEAALCGKTNVVRALLARGADPRIQDRAGDTVLDALSRFPPHVTHDIVALIKKYRLSNGFDSDAEDLPRIPVHQHDGLNSPYDNVQPQTGSGHHRGHVWERRDVDDERRVSGTSAVSMNYQTDLVPMSYPYPNIPTKTYQSPNVVLGLASKCFGVKQPLSETHTLPYSKPADVKKEKKSKKKEKSSMHTSKTGFFRRTFGIFDSTTKLNSKSEKMDERLRKTTSLPDILDNPIENVQLDSGSESSIVSVSNSIYGSARNSQSLIKSTDNFQDPENHVYEEYSVTDSIDYMHNINFDEFDQSIKNNNSLKPPENFARRNSGKITYTKILPISGINNIDVPKPKTRIPKSKSYNYDNMPPPNLFISHSVRSPKNWSSDNAYFKNNKPIYFSTSNLEVPGRNNLYYAMLDFQNPTKDDCKEEINNDYELYDFTEAKAKAQLERKNTFKPIEVFHENSTVFVEVEKRADANTKDVNKFLSLGSLVFEGVTSDSEKDQYSTGSLSSKPIPAPRKGTNPTTRIASQISTVTRYSSFLENQDLHNMISKYQESSKETSVDETVERRSHKTITNTISTKVNPPDSIRSSINTIIEKDSDSSSFGSRSDGDEYMDINAVMNFSERISQLASQSASLGTLKHIADEEDPVYDNVNFPEPVKIPPLPKPHGSVYHMRGSQDCIYDEPHTSKYIYIFNKESLTDFDVQPFIRITRDSSLDMDIRNICFCGPEQKNIYMSTEDINDRVIMELYSCYKARMAELSEEDTFTCYCDDFNCEFHHTKSFFKSNSVVSYSARTNSVTIPNTKLSQYTNEPKSEFETKYNLSAFVTSPTSENFDFDATTISFRSVLEDPIDVVEPDQTQSRLSNLSLYSNASSFGEFHRVLSETTGTGSLCRPVLEGGRSLCVRSGSDGGHYLYSKSSGMDGSYHSEELSSSYQSGKIREPDQLSISSTTSSTGGPSPRERQRCGTNESSVSAQGIYMSMGASQGYHAHSPGSNTKVSPTPPKKPPRRNLSVSPTHLLPPGSVLDSLNSNQRSHHLARTGQTRSQDDLDDLEPETKTSGLRHGRSVDHYVDSKVSPRTKPVPQPRPSLALLASRRDQPVAINAMYENVVIKEQNPRRKLRRNTQQQQFDNNQPREANNGKYHSSQERSSLESLLDDASSSYHGGTPSDGEPIGYGRSSQNTPLSPTHYNQPPTPDHPPPSAKQAEMSIHERIRPLSQEYKRMSRDMETETDPRFLARSSSPASSASTDHCVEEYVAEVPFAGLFKGSTTTLDGIGVRPVPAERPKSLRKLKNVYDNGIQSLGIGVAGNRPKEIQPGTRIDPDVDPWQYRHAEDKDQISNPPSSASLDKPLSMLSPFDEQEEWAKINEIMASFGSRLVRESVFAEELEQEFQSRLGARFSCSESSLSPCAPAGPSVLSWLTGLGLQHLESNFVNNGYDHVDFINGVIEDSDLAEMAIEEPEKTKVLESCKTLPNKIDEVLSVSTVKSQSNINNNNNISNNNVDKESENDPEAVNKWLTSIGLECYQETFRKHLYTDMERVRRIWEVELTAVLEIQKVGHRRRILASVAGRQNGPINNIEDLKALNTLEKNIQTLNAEIKEKLPDLTSASNATTTTTAQTNNAEQPAKPSPAPNQLTASAPGGETLKRSHKKNRPPPPPPARGVDLEIRAPCALMVGVPGTLCTQWKHQPLSLVTGSVMYVANYLGSTIVKELRGKESTQKSIQKLKKSTNEPRALPDIILSISYRGVKFLNTITRNLVCEHEIRNIHCACQDADDLTHFAYITKDITTKSHYCHVFCVATMDQATEVILTLGQAFEVAYQMALRESSSRSNTLQRQHKQQQQQQQGQQGQQVRSQSSNQISQQAKTPTHEKTSNGAKDRPNPVHGRSHSVTEIKLNGHQLKVAPISVSLSNEDFQSTSKNGDGQKSPRTPSAKAPIVLAEEL